MNQKMGVECVDCKKKEPQVLATCGSCLFLVFLASADRRRTSAIVKIKAKIDGAAGCCLLHEKIPCLLIMASP
jgi:hypothetical protein